MIDWTDDELAVTQRALADLYVKEGTHDFTHASRAALGALAKVCREANERATDEEAARAEEERLHIRYYDEDNPRDEGYSDYDHRNQHWSSLVEYDDSGMNDDL